MKPHIYSSRNSRARAYIWVSEAISISVNPPLSIDGLSRVNTERLRSTTKIRDRLYCRASIHSVSMLVLISGFDCRLKRDGVHHLPLGRPDVVESLFCNRCFTASYAGLVKLVLNRVIILVECLKSLRKAQRDCKIL